MPCDPHCCGVLSLTELKECARLGITCGSDEGCARWQLALVRLTDEEAV